MSGIKVEAGGQLSPRQKGGQKLLPTEPQSWQAGAIFETLSTWLTLFAPPWKSPEILSHPIYGSIQAVNRDFSI